MAERTRIFGAKKDSPQIGYIEGNEAFDLFGRKRCNYSVESGNLYDPNSGRIVGHVSLQGKFVGLSWIADELFPRSDNNTHQETLRRERSSIDSGPVVVGEIFGQRDAEDPPADHSIGTTPSPPSSEQDAPAAELFSKSWMAILTREDVRKEGYLNGPGLVVADENLEQCDAEDENAGHSISETPIPPPSEQDAPAAELFSKSWMAILTRKDVRKEGYLNGPGLVVPGEIFEQCDAEDPNADHSIGETPSPPSSEQGEPAAVLFSISDGNTHQDILRGAGSLNGPGLVVAGEIFEQCDAEDPNADHSIGETPSPPPSEQNKSAAEGFSKSGDTTQETARREGHLTSSGLVVAHDAAAANADHSIGETPSTTLSEQGEPALEQVLKSLMAKLAGKALRKERNPNRLDLVAAGEISGRRDTEAASADHTTGEAPSSPPSEQGETAAGLFSKSEDHAYQEIVREAGPNLVVADEIFEQHHAEATYAHHGIGEMPSPPLSEQDKLAAVTISPGEQSARDPTEAFFPLDVEHAVEIVRKKLGKEGYTHSPGLITAGETPDPTITFFSVDMERAVGMVRNELGKEGNASYPGLVVAGEILDPTREFFSVDVEGAVGIVRRELEKASR